MCIRQLVFVTSLVSFAYYNERPFDTHMSYCVATSPRTVSHFVAFYAFLFVIDSLSFLSFCYALRQSLADLKRWEEVFAKLYQLNRLRKILEFPQESARLHRRSKGANARQHCGHSLPYSRHRAALHLLRARLILTVRVATNLPPQRRLPWHRRDERDGWTAIGGDLRFPLCIQAFFNVHFLRPTHITQESGTFIS